MRRLFLVLAVMFAACSVLHAQAASADLYKKQPKAHTRWISFENPTGAKGQGGKENRGGKGHAFDSLKAGETRVLLNLQGPGVIRRMWFTLRERDPRMMRALRLEMFWDNADTPAISVPFGDFFGAILGRPVAFESELFSNPEGRSFNCYIPMPFRKAAKVTITNESERNVIKLFYDIEVLLTGQSDPEALYFHSTWRRERWTKVGNDFEILPIVRGEGRFLGAHVGVIINPDNVGWWGEGAVKMYVDGDSDYPTIVGTGTEEYVGTGWGLRTFANHYQGSLFTDQKNGQFGFYRYHIPDPVYFHKDIRVTIQQLGGTSKSQVLELLKKGVPVQPVSVEYARQFVKLLEMSPVPDFEKRGAPPSAFTCIYRQDDFSAVALFYLDSPVNGLPRIAPVDKRLDAILESVPPPTSTPQPGTAPLN